MIARRESERRQRVACAARRGIGEGVHADGAGEAVVAVHTERPAPSRRNRDDAGGFRDEVVLLNIDGEPGKGEVAGEVRAATGVQVVDGRGVRGEHGRLLRWRHKNGLCRREIAHANVRADVPHREAGDVVLVADAVGARDPARGGEVVRDPGEADVASRQINARWRCVRDEQGHLKILADSIADIRELFGVWIEPGGAGTVGPGQRQKFTTYAQLKIGVQRRSGDPSIFARSEHDEEAARRKVRPGKLPFEAIPRAVAQAPADEIHGVGPGVEEFNPV